MSKIPRPPKKDIIIPVGCVALQQIYVQKNKLKRIVFEGVCPALILLDASNNQLTAFKLPFGFKALSYLYLMNDQLEVVRFQSDLKSLNTLPLGGQ